MGFLFILGLCFLGIKVEAAVKIGNEWPWPHPQIMTIAEDTSDLVLLPGLFKIRSNIKCTVITSAIKRYMDLIFLHSQEGSPASSRLSNQAAVLSNLQIQITSSRTCVVFPTPGMDESYTLEINTPNNPAAAKLIAVNEWGALRGLETFSQLVSYSPESTQQFTTVKSVYIKDYPRFSSHRGLMIDTARHFIPIPVLKSLLDGMSWNKLNVFHWHLSDNEAFSYNSEQWSEVSLGAAQIYSSHDILDLINYAALRGIRVIPEFGTPSHINSWRPETLTECPGIADKLFNVASNSSYNFLQDFFHEITNLFPDPYLHFGGDEVDPSCWMENQFVSSFKEARFSNYEQLENYHYTRLMGIAKKYAKRSIFWEDPLGEDKNGDIRLDPAANTLIQVWKPMAGFTGWKSNVARIAKLSYKMILSAPWYLSHYPSPSDEILKEWYGIEPWSFTRNSSLQRLMIGGEGVIWTEDIDSSNISRIVWPSLAIIAEKLWSSRRINDWGRMRSRFQEQRCRLKLRGLDVGEVSGDFDNECLI